MKLILCMLYEVEQPNIYDLLVPQLCWSSELYDHTVPAVWHLHKRRFPLLFIFLSNNWFPQSCKEVFLWKKGHVWPADKYKSDIQNGLSPFEGNPCQSRQSPGESTRKDTNNKKKRGSCFCSRETPAKYSEREREKSV